MNVALETNWAQMQRTRRNVDSGPQSPTSEDDGPFAKSPTETDGQRGRTSKTVQEEVNAQFSEEMDTKN